MKLYELIPQIFEGKVAVKDNFSVIHKNGVLLFCSENLGANQLVPTAILIEDGWQINHFPIARVNSQMEAIQYIFEHPNTVAHAVYTDVKFKQGNTMVVCGNVVRYHGSTYDIQYLKKHTNFEFWDIYPKEFLDE